MKVRLGKVMMTTRGEYNPTRVYEYLDVVSLNNATYVSMGDNNSNHTPTSSPLYWMKMVGGGSGEGSGFTSFSVAVPSGMTATSPITPDSNTLTIGFESGYGLVSPEDRTNWNKINTLTNVSVLSTITAQDVANWRNGTGQGSSDLNGYYWWGRSFNNGTAITGALDNVTDINMSGHVVMPNSGYIQIGEGRIKWDNESHAFYIEDSNGNACHMYVSGALSTLGVGSGGSGGGSSPANLGTMLTAMNVDVTPTTGYLYYDGTDFAWQSVSTEGGTDTNWYLTGVSLNTTTMNATFTMAGTTAITADFSHTHSYNDLTDRPSIPTTDTIIGWGFTKTTGTVTQVTAGTGLTTGEAPITTSGTISLATVGTPGTYAKVVVDAYGRVTDSASLVASDIPNISWNKITSDKPTTLSGYGILDGMSFTAAAGNAYVRAMFTNSSLAPIASGTKFIEWQQNGNWFNHKIGSLSAIGDVIIGTDVHDTTHGLQIGGGVILWDDDNKALYVQQADGSICGLYATGTLASLGAGSTSGSVNSLTLGTLRVTGNTTLYNLTATGQVVLDDLEVNHNLDVWNNLSVSGNLWMNSENIYMDDGNILDVGSIDTDILKVGEGPEISNVSIVNDALQITTGGNTYTFAASGTAYPFYYSVTQSGGTYTLSTTFANLQSAFNSRGFVVLHFDNKVYALTNVNASSSPTQMVFTYTEYNGSTLTCSKLTVTSSGVTHSSHTLNMAFDSSNSQLSITAS